MGNPTQEQLAQRINESWNVEELETRVSHMHGVAHVDRAKLLAVQLKGPHWVFEEYRPVKPRKFPTLHAMLAIPSNVILVVLAVTLTVVLLFPPRVLHLPGGTTVHSGFAFLFGWADNRQLGAVNVILLAIELATVAAVGGISLMVARSYENQRPRTR